MTKELAKEAKETIQSCLDMMEHIKKADEMLLSVISKEIQPLLGNYFFKEARAVVETFYAPSLHLSHIFTGKETVLHEIWTAEYDYKISIGEESLWFEGYEIQWVEELNGWVVSYEGTIASIETYDSIEDAKNFILEQI